MELLMGSAAAAFFMFAAAKWNKTDKEKIQRTFENVGYVAGDKYPKLFKTHKAENSTLYTYHVPFGLVDDDKLHVLEKTLNKPVDISFVNGKLHIRVYKYNLPTKTDYYSFDYKGGWEVPIGTSRERNVYHDFDRIPHMIVSGSTTWGKTVFMRMMMTHLIENNPEGVEFYILDLKGKLAFNRYRNLKQVKAVAGNYRESREALTMVKKSINDDLNYLLKVDAENAKEGSIPTRKFIIIDEAGELMPKPSMEDEEKQDIKKCQQIMSYIARVAGQVGYKMIFGTQYPTAEILDNQIKANAVARVSFRLTTAVQSGVAIDQSGAEKLEYPGRAIYKTADEHLVQSPFISKDEIWERLCVYNDGSAAEKNTTSREDTIEFG